MATLQGGIFSRPRGKTGGLVFGAARTRTGKLVTSRLLVPPSNPNTAAQQTQRSIFSSCQAIIRRLGASVYQVDWNRSVGQLPGFQSMQSIFMNQMASNLNLTLVNDINLGTLEPLLTLEFGVAAADSLTLSWDPAVTGNGTAADVVIALAIAQTEAKRPQSNGVQVFNTAVRSDETLDITNLDSSTTYELYVYAVGAGTAEGLISVASAMEDTTTA
jgi:Fibronectin type III domain